MKLLPALALLSVTLNAAYGDTPASPKRIAPAPVGNARIGTAQNAPLVCPVSGDKIASLKAAYSSEVYQGKTYYFCCPECKPMFDKNPAKYVGTASAHKS